MTGRSISRSSKRIDRKLPERENPRRPPPKNRLKSDPPLAPDPVPQRVESEDELPEASRFSSAQKGPLDRKKAPEFRINGDRPPSDRLPSKGAPWIFIQAWGSRGPRWSGSKEATVGSTPTNLSERRSTWSRGNWSTSRANPGTG